MALQLHHKELRIAHLLLAIALTARTANQLTCHGLDRDVIRRCCWRALEAVTPEPNEVPDVTPSAEINELYGHAATFSNGKELEIDHILRAINDVKLVGQFGQLIRNPVPRPEDINAQISEIREQLDKELPEIENRVAEIGDEQDALHKKIDTLQESIGGSGREGSLHRSMDVLRSYTTTLKYIVIVSAVTLAFVMAMIRIVGGR
jgi:hypothetical protein